MPLPVAKFLENFSGVEEPPAFTPLVPDKPGRPELPAIMPLIEEKQPEPVGPDPAMLAREEGYHEGYAAAKAEFDMAMAQQANEYFDRLNDERQRWVSQEAESLSSKLGAAVAALAEQLSTNVDAILRPFIISAIRKQMIDELAQSVDVLISGAGEDHRPIVISGSEDFLEILRSKLTSAPAIDFQPNESADIKIVVDDTIIQSQLQTWIERFNISEE